MVYWLIKWLSSLIRVLPIGLRNALGDMLGELCWPLVPGKRKKMAISNVIRSLQVSAREARTIVKASATRFGRMFMEVLCMPEFDKGYLEKHVVFSGRHYLEEALARGRGVILATAHSGNWELLGAALAIEGFPIVGVAQKQTNAQMDKFICEYRTQSGMHITYKTGVREMVKLLGEGRIIGLLMDQDAHDGVMVDFFGRLASTPQGPAALARMKNAPIVPVFITETGKGNHTIIVHPPLEVTISADRNQDILEMTAILTKIIEGHIIEHPREWFWLHNRWKHSPPA